MFFILLEGAWVSVEIFFLTLIFALPLALPVMFCRMSKNVFLRTIIGFYVLITRGTPLILQLIFIYFAPSYLYRFLFGILGEAVDAAAFWGILKVLLSYNRFVAVIIAFVLNYAAYFAEIYRGGIASIPIGQYEAARALGLSERQVFSKVVLPQFVKRILPAMGNEVITLVKDTALAQVIGVAELFHYARSASSRDFSTIPIFIAGLFYLTMNWIVSLA
ncbi:MAG: amino acid ABC transporter permease, partial [Spirochaetaceae bacterium]|nr:amino acid ABC transporter permease [Spirochaetaceae bacterium]